MNKTHTFIYAFAAAHLCDVIKQQQRFLLSFMMFVVYARKCNKDAWVYK